MKQNEKTTEQTTEQTQTADVKRVSLNIEALEQRIAPTSVFPSIPGRTAGWGC